MSISYTSGSGIPPAPSQITEDLTTQDVETGTLVNERFQTSKDYSDWAMSEAQGYLNDLKNVIGNDIGLSWTPSTPEEVEYPPALLALNPVSAANPDISQIEVAPVEFPYSIETGSVSELPNRTVPTFGVALPTFLDPAAPDDEVPEFTAQEPAITSPVLPGRDDYTLPPVPQLTEVTVPSEPEFNTPTFQGVRPEYGDLTPPDATFVWNEAEYDSEVLEALKIKIRDGILTGGTGLDPAVEQAIYDRAAARLDVELQKNENIALNDFASRGSRLPSGALVARLQETQLQNALAREDLTKDVMIKSADLAFQYSTFIIEKGIALEHELMAFANEIANRAFEAAKFGLEWAIRAFEAKITLCKVKAELYKIDAEIFEALIRTEIAKAELYKATIEGRKLSLQMQELTVNLYEKQVGAIGTLIEMRNSTLQGVKIENEINALQIDKFKALTDAYEKRLSGITAKYNLYQAQLAGDETKAKVYGIQVDAFSKQVDSVKTTVEADIARLQGELEPIRLDTEVFKARIGKYNSDIQAAISQAEIQAKNEDLKLKVYDGEVKEFAATVDALTKAYLAKSEVNIANVEADIKYGEVLSKIEIAKAEIDKSVVEAQARIVSQLASAALTSVSAGASLQYSQSRGDTTKYNVSRSHGVAISDKYNHSDSVSNIHSYKEKCCGDDS